MKQELQDKLFTDFPGLFYEKDLPATQTCMCWGLDCGDGWYDLIYKACLELQHHTIRFSQVKEKYGGLRLYWGGTVFDESLQERR